MNEKYIIFFGNDAFRFITATSFEKALILQYEMFGEGVLKHDEFATIIYHKISEWSPQDMIEFYNRIAMDEIKGVYNVSKTLYTTYENN